MTHKGERSCSTLLTLVKAVLKEHWYHNQSARSRDNDAECQDRGQN